MAIFQTFKFLQVIQARKKSFRIFQNEKTPFQSIKTTGLKYRKIYIFPKGLTHGFSPLMAIFGIFFLKALKARKMFFTTFKNEKTSLQNIKTKCSKRRKIDIFSKGLAHGFRQKMAIFPTFFLKALKARKMSFTISKNEKASLQAIKTRCSKSQKIDIF